MCSTTKLYGLSTCHTDVQVCHSVYGLTAQTRPYTLSCVLTEFQDLALGCNQTGRAGRHTRAAPPLRRSSSEWWEGPVALQYAGIKLGSDVDQEGYNREHHHYSPSRDEPSRRGSVRQIHVAKNITKRVQELSEDYRTVGTNPSQGTISNLAAIQTCACNRLCYRDATENAIRDLLFRGWSARR